jgi:endonuclease YncB( thermonuclease family)
LVSRRSLLLGAGLTLASLTSFPEMGGADLSTWVRINSTMRPVYFNDGDTFRQLAGPMRNRPARLAGFNTLESYGPVHQWLGFTAHELYANAKQATLNARRGMWECLIDAGDKDGYGRLLANCPELAEDQIRKGLAHALSIGGPSPKRLIEAQRHAIVNRYGMWAKGVPALVLTSLHSVDERLNNKDNYNRLVSPLDGVSTKWKHQNKYVECETVCFRAKLAERAGLLAVIAALRADDATKDVVHGYEDRYLMALLNEFNATSRVAHVFEGDGHAAVKAKLDALLTEGTFGPLREQDSACMVYVAFDRRYRADRAECLR